MAEAKNGKRNSKPTKEERIAAAMRAREAVRAQNPDLTEEEAIEIALKVRDEVLERLIKKQNVRFKAPDASSTGR
jgi:hypothetical protein